MKTIPEIIVACDRRGGFGKDGKIPWSLPDDLKHFKSITDGHVCIMGRNTYNEILDGRIKRDAARGINEDITEILRGRESFVVTSDPTYQTPGARVVDGLGIVMSAMSIANDKRKLFVLGGYRMFVQALSWTNTIHMTVLKGEPYDCDVYFPIDVVNRKFKIVSGKETDNAYYVVYQRK